tara:strand:- start:228 stop:728 length:501 start_codon:yes stop_codon:yes gene_type:complete
MKVFILIITLFIGLANSQDVEYNIYGSQLSAGTLFLGSEILAYDVVGNNAPTDVQGDPTFTLKPELGYFVIDNLGIYARYYKENGNGTEYGLGLMYTFPDFYMSGVYKPKDENDQHLQGTFGKLFQLQNSPAYLNIGLNYSLYTEKEYKQLQLLVKGLYVGIGMAF